MTETIAGSLLFLRLESTAERKRRGPAKTGPTVDPIAVSASPRRVGRSVGSTPRFGRDCWPQGRPHSTPYSESGWANADRKDREVGALRGPHGVSGTRGLARRHREALPRAGW